MLDQGWAGRWEMVKDWLEISQLASSCPPRSQPDSQQGCQIGQDSQETLPEPLKQSVLSIGNFDGVHLGHRDLFSYARGCAHPGQKVIAVTFDPHPRALLRPKDTGPPLLTLRRKVEKLKQNGVDQVVVFRIDTAFLDIPAQDFFDRIIRGILDPARLIEGDNFCFGRKREGTISRLGELCENSGIKLDIHPGLTDKEGWISTSRIRNLLLKGEVAEAGRLLGETHETEAEVIAGAQRGRTLGFPTANLAQPQTLVPSIGVYAAQAILPDGTTYGAAVNIGPNPTFGENAFKIEAHILDYSGNLYGKLLRLEWIDRIRGPVAFSTIEELKNQIQTDLQQTRAILEKSGCGNPDGARNHLLGAKA